MRQSEKTASQISATRIRLPILEYTLNETAVDELFNMAHSETSAKISDFNSIPRKEFLAIEGKTPLF